MAACDGGGEDGACVVWDRVCYEGPNGGEEGDAEAGGAFRGRGCGGVSFDLDGESGELSGCYEEGAAGGDDLGVVCH